MSEQSLTTLEQLSPEELERAKYYAAQSKATNSVAAYTSRWRQYVLWNYCLSNGLPRKWFSDWKKRDRKGYDKFMSEVLPSLMRETQITVAEALRHLLDLADHGASVSTLNQTIAAISHYSRLLKLPDPMKDDTLCEIVDGIRRTKLIAPQKKEAIIRDELRKMVSAIPDTLTGLRDRALLILGWNGAFRRSEIAGLKVEDIRFNGDLKVTLGKSKTDQEGEGQVKVIPPDDDDPALCPMRSLRAWMDAADIKTGPLFRHVDKWNHVGKDGLSPQTVALAIKHYARVADLDWRKMSGHSLRSGFITSAISGGATDTEVMQLTGHKSPKIMRDYNQDAGRAGKRAITAARKSG